MTAPVWGDLAVTELRCPDGGSVVIADHGAHVLSWIPASSAGQPALFLSAGSGFGADAAIRGGVPIIFPQFNSRGPGKRHGFARVSPWHRSFAGIEQGRALARYTLSEADVDAGAWGHRFTLEYEVSASAAQLQLSLSVTNTDFESWSFQAALHTYLQVAAIADISLNGLQGLAYLDTVGAETMRMQIDEPLRIVAETDRIYTGLTEPLRLRDGARSVLVRQSGFTDAVVWNPGPAKAATIADLEQGGDTRFICVEAGTILTPVTLAPGASWQGRQILEVQGATA